MQMGASRMKRATCSLLSVRLWLSIPPYLVWEESAHARACVRVCVHVCSCACVCVCCALDARLVMYLCMCMYALWAHVTCLGLIEV